MTKTDTPINIEVAQDPVHGDWDVSMCMCHTPRRIYVDNLTELGTDKNVHIYVERKTCEMEYVNEWMGWHCKTCDNIKMGLSYQKPRYCPNCGAEVME